MYSMEKLSVNLFNIYGRCLRCQCFVIYVSQHMSLQDQTYSTLYVFLFKKERKAGKGNQCL